MQIQANSTDVSVTIFAVDEVTGLPRTGLEASDVIAYYARTRGNPTAVSASALTDPDDAHADGGFIEVDADNMKGVYRFDVPDAAFASGAGGVTIVLQAAGALLRPVDVQLTTASGGGLTPGLAEELHLCKAALVNRRVHTVSTGVNQIKDDDGTTTLVTLTPTDGGEDTIVIEPS